MFFLLFLGLGLYLLLKMVDTSAKHSAIISIYVASIKQNRLWDLLCKDISLDCWISSPKYIQILYVIINKVFIKCRPMICFNTLERMKKRVTTLSSAKRYVFLASFQVFYCEDFVTLCFSSLWVFTRKCIVFVLMYFFTCKIRFSMFLFSSA